MRVELERQARKRVSHPYAFAIGTRANGISSSRARTSGARGGRAKRALRVWVGNFRHGPSPRVAPGQAAPEAPSDPGPTIARMSEAGAARDDRQAYELLLIEEADAWFEYLEATRGQTAVRYGEVEPWAWARLRQRLRAIRARRARVRPAAA